MITQRQAHENSARHGFWDEPRTDALYAAKIALIHEEASEALGCLRDGDIELRFEGEKRKPEGLAAELADVVIRCMDLAEALGVDLEQAIDAKHALNVTRPFKHGRKANL